VRLKGVVLTIEKGQREACKCNHSCTWEAHIHMGAFNHPKRVRWDPCPSRQTLCWMMVTVHHWGWRQSVEIVRGTFLPLLLPLSPNLSHVCLFFFFLILWVFFFWEKKLVFWYLAVLLFFRKAGKRFLILFDMCNSGREHNYF
jgi:hypothetical protein